MSLLAVVFGFILLAVIFFPHFAFQTIETCNSNYRLQTLNSFFVLFSFGFVFRIVYDIDDKIHCYLGCSLFASDDVITMTNN